MNSKIVLLSRILPLITGCSTQVKDIQYLHDDNGFPYTEEELNRKNTFHNQYEYVSDYDSSGKLKSPLQFDVKKTGDKKPQVLCFLLLSESDYYVTVWRNSIFPLPLIFIVSSVLKILKKTSDIKS